MLQRYRTRNGQVYSKGAHTREVHTNPSAHVPPLQQRASFCVRRRCAGVSERANASAFREPTHPRPDCIRVCTQPLVSTSASVKPRWEVASEPMAHLWDQYDPYLYALHTLQQSGADANGSKAEAHYECEEEDTPAALGLKLEETYISTPGRAQQLPNSKPLLPPSPPTSSGVGRAPGGELGAS